MIFNSLTFYIFLPIVFCLYWITPQQKWRNIILLIASYIFYGWWDWRFLSLIIASSFVDYYVGLKLVQASILHKKYWLWTSLGFNLGLLGFFKYYNFFVDSLKISLTEFGINLNYSTLEIILPVGISFYTFQTLSYSIDIYRGKLKPTNNLIAFFTFVSFFPQLVAGPIERASHLLPQFFQIKKFDYSWAVSGARLILWGLFKKVVIADNLAVLVDSIFTRFEVKAGWFLYEGLIFFAIQIYCDFSGYSDIARGVSRWFGIDIMRNFHRPYIAQSFRDFWSRWHISLSTWFKDYVYIPLGGNKKGKLYQINNLGITFMISGLWHGANWTFVIWGFLHAIYYIPETAARNLQIIKSYVPKWLRIGIVFNAVLIAWTFFRSPNLDFAFSYLKKMCYEILLHPGSIVFFKFNTELGLVVGLFVIEYLMKEREDPFYSTSKVLRWGLYTVAALSVIWFQSYHSTSSFIYFQF